MKKKLILSAFIITASMGCVNQVREVKRTLDATIGIPFTLLGGNRRATIVNKKTYWFQNSQDLLDFEKHNNYSIETLDSDKNKIITEKEYNLAPKIYASNKP